MHKLIAVAMPANERFAITLKRIWDSGDALLPLDTRASKESTRILLEKMEPSELIDSKGDHIKLPHGVPVEEDDAVVVATSGTTGEPRGVVLTHQAVFASALATSKRLEVDPNKDHWLACLPLAHIGGLSVVMRAILTGTKVTLLEKFSPAAVEEAAIHGGANLVSLVPTALKRIDPSLFLKILIGGSAMLDELPPNAVTTYGMTETGSGVVYDGIPLDGVEMRIAEDGQILLKGPMLLRCYRDGHDPKSADGWLATKDLGHLGEDGRLHVDGRIDELIISGGEKIWPQSVERVLAEHPKVREVAITGIPDPYWGQAVVALIVPTDIDNAPSLDELREMVSDKLAPYAAPKRAFNVSDLPRTNLGKLQRSALANWAA